MSKFCNKNTLLVLLMASTQAHAFTPDELFATAMIKGIAKGVLTGNLAERIKAETHSTESTQVILEREEVTPDGCQLLKMTITQPKVPLRQGGFAGDYTTVSRVVTCKDDRPATQPQVLECTVGGVSCMPPR